MKYKLIIGSPDDEEVIQRVIDAATKAGAGQIGKYSRCATVTKIKGTWKSEPGARPEDGEIGKISTVDCVWIETECTEDRLKDVIQSVRKVHPYEEPGIQVLKLEDIAFE